MKLLRAPVWLGAIVLVAAALRLWDMGHGGWGTAYYTAGVRSMLQSWHNFFFNAFDPAGYISLDKPPVAFWVQAASAKLLGFGPVAVLLPQVLEGIAAVLLVYHLVRRRFGAGAGLLAALFLALTPISVAVDRSSNTDSCLVLLLLLAAWAVSLAAERGSWRHLVSCGVLLGIAFNTKMLAALVVVPTFGLVYLAGAPVALRARIVHLALAGAALAAVSLAWVAAFDLTPPQARPYAGSSATNSMLDLVIEHNGLQRFFRPGTARPPPSADPAADTGRSRFDDIQTGLFRLATPRLAAQVGWLLPLALVGTGAVLLRQRRAWPLTPVQQSLLLWGGWAGTYALVYSYAGGIFHAYYLVTLAPPLAALAGIGLAEMRPRPRPAEWHALLLPAALLLTAAWQAYIQQEQVEGATADWPAWLQGFLIVGSLLAAAALLFVRSRRARPAAAALGLAAVLATPAAWALSSVLAPGNAMLPSARLSQLTGKPDESGPPAGQPAANPVARRRLVAFLQANRNGERFLLAVPNALRAAPMIIDTGEAVMAIGGFLGSDPILTADEFARKVEGGELRFVLWTDTRPFGRGEASEARAEAFSAWIAQHGRVVDPALWRAPAPPRPPAERPGDDPSRPDPAPDDPSRPDPGAGAATADPGARTSPQRRQARAATLRLIDLRPSTPLVPTRPDG